MSLDIYLEAPTESQGKCTCDRCGHEHPTTYRERFFERNITHNLGQMFNEAGVYEILWEGDGLVAGEVLDKLRNAYDDMVHRPAHYAKFNALNGWGMYEHALPFLAAVIEACAEHPTAVLRCSR